MAKDTRDTVVVNPFDVAAKAAQREQLTNVRLLINVPPYRAGECAGIDPTIAEHYIKFGVAQQVAEHGGRLYTEAEWRAVCEQRAREDAERRAPAPVVK